MLAAALVSSGVMTTAALCQSAVFKADQPDCQDDAIRLCAAAIPDRDKVNACLGFYHAHLSAACRAFVAPPADGSGEP